MTSGPPQIGSSAVTASAAWGERLSKSFAGARVLRDVNIDIAPGEIHALLGANGSGKSTLVKCLTGVYQPDAGTIVVGERRLSAIASPQEADRLGIAVVHQEAPLIDSFTVAECIALFRGYPTAAGARICWTRLRDEVAGMFARFGLAIDPSILAGKLTAAERAMVAIVIALERVKGGLRLLVLDEVTASLPRNQAEPYLEQVMSLARSGVGVLMITHRLAELQGRAAKVTLLRDGAVVYRAEAGDIDETRVVKEMVGAASPVRMKAAVNGGALADLWIAREAETAPRRSGGEPALALEDVSGARLRGLSMTVAAGEIVGVAGLSEAGVTELPLVLSGALRRRGGRIAVAGKTLPDDARPRDVIRAGLAVLPADRLRSGGIGSLSIGENALLPDFARYWHQPKREPAVLASLVDKLDIRPPNPMALFGRLSGGNQQKTILGKWLLLRPTVLVLDDPTNGVDPNARNKIFELLRDAAAGGVGVLVFSTEPEQFASICSRVVILREGKIVKEIAGNELTAPTISRWCYG